jgi:3-oxoacyl-(acyl-carrier-protein) synthase
VDARARDAAGDPVIIATGRGHVTGACDPRPYLKNPKMRKFMGPQDALAVVAAARALEAAGLAGRDLGERAGLYIAVGHLPFEEEDIDRLLDGSLVDGRFSMKAFAEGGYHAVNPLITFRCLSNMPAFHASSNFDIQGPYLVTYPDVGQTYAALDEARAALLEGRVDVALLVGVAHQRNFLVEHHARRVTPPQDVERLVDAAGCLVLERPGRAPARARLERLDLGYEPLHPFEETRAPEESFSPDVELPGELGAASMPVALSLAPAGAFTHAARTRDGHVVSSAWQVSP